MQKIIFSLFICGVFLCGCTSVSTDSGKLTETEQLTIVDIARYTITQNRKNKRFVTDQEAAIISKQMPEVKIHYTGPRQGRMYISWHLKHKSINFVYSGNFLANTAMWQMTIAKHDSKLSKKKVKISDKIPQATEKDFSDLRRKDRIQPKKPQ